LRLVREFVLDAGSGVNFGVIVGMDLGMDGSIVFAADGRFLGTVKPAQHLTALVVRGNRAIGLGETPDGEHVIHVYRIDAVP